MRLVSGRIHFSVNSLLFPWPSGRISFELFCSACKRIKSRVNSFSGEMEAQPRKAGRQLPPWQPLEVVQLGAASLREGSLQWLAQKGHVTYPLAASSDKGASAYLARCKKHSECTKKWRFLGGEDGAIKVFQLGDHAELSIYLSIYLSICLSSQRFLAMLLRICLSQPNGLRRCPRLVWEIVCGLVGFTNYTDPSDLWPGGCLVVALSFFFSSFYIDAKQ